MISTIRNLIDYLMDYLAESPADELAVKIVKRDMYDTVTHYKIVPLSYVTKTDGFVCLCIETDDLNKEWVENV